MQITCEPATPNGGRANGSTASRPLRPAAFRLRPPTLSGRAAVAELGCLDLRESFPGMSTVKSAPEKKRIGYERDHYNRGGENDKFRGRPNLSRKPRHDALFAKHPTTCSR